MVGHRKSGHTHHGQVVGTVADRDRLVRPKPMAFTGGQQHATLFIAVADITPGLVHQGAGQSALGHLQHIAACVVQAQSLTHCIGEVGEATADQQGTKARGLAGLDQDLGARVELQALLEHLLQRFHRNALQQGHASAQTVLVIGDFSPHGGLGDGRHFGFAACCIGYLVHALDVDEGGVHVEGDESEVLQAKRR